MGRLSSGWIFLYPRLWRFISGPCFGTETATTNANPIVVSTVNTAGLAVGDVVRLMTILGRNRSQALEYTVTAINPGVSFSLGYARCGSGSAGTGGFFRRIPFQAPFYPRNRTITFISQAVQAEITMSVTHGSSQWVRESRYWFLRTGEWWKPITEYATILAIDPNYQHDHSRFGYLWLYSLCIPNFCSSSWWRRSSSSRACWDDSAITMGKTSWMMRLVTLRLEVSL